MKKDFNRISPFILGGLTGLVVTTIMSSDPLFNIAIQLSIMPIFGIGLILLSRKLKP